MLANVSRALLQLGFMFVGLLGVLGLPLANFGCLVLGLYLRTLCHSLDGEE